VTPFDYKSEPGGKEKEAGHTWPTSFAGAAPECFRRFFFDLETFPLTLTPERPRAADP
jgi:hypothetical protein